MSAYGGVICLNRRVDREPRRGHREQFVEVLFAPGYDEDALEVLEAKRNMRILDDRERRNPDMIDPELRQVVGGMLVQDRDYDLEERAEMQVVSQRDPTEAEWGELPFAWKVCKHVRSNAIVMRRDLATVGIGAGQMSRVDSVRLAIEKARSTLQGSVLASDAYFPFADGPQLAIERRHDRDHPARRLDPRPRGGRGRRRRRRGDGLHRAPPLPPLAFAGGRSGRASRGTLAMKPRICQLQRQSPTRPGAGCARYAIMDPRRRSSAGRAADF